MMSVENKKILLENIGSGTTINIALGSDFFPIDNAELIQDKFVKEEKEKVINPIEDYKKIIFEPAYENWFLFTQFRINLNFYTPESIALGSPNYYDYLNGANVAGMYSHINFTFDDIFCRANKFMFSFLRFTFYDNPHSGDNTVLFYSDIYTQVGPECKNQFGIVVAANKCPITFLLGDPVLQPDLIHEGFHIYWFKDLVDNAPGQEYVMYMTAVYSNASNGQTVALSTSKIPDPDNVQMTDLDGEEGILYLKVVLKNDNGIYKYRFEPNDKQTPALGGVNLTAGTLATLLFWQISP